PQREPRDRDLRWGRQPFGLLRRAVRLFAADHLALDAHRERCSEELNHCPCRTRTRARTRTRTRRLRVRVRGRKLQRGCLGTTVAIAIAAMASPAPMTPSPSIVFALIAT